MDAAWVRGASYQVNVERRRWRPAPLRLAEDSGFEVLRAFTPLFGSARALLLWFGLAGGALMALTFMLRSLTRR